MVHRLVTNVAYYSVLSAGKLTSSVSCVTDMLVTRVEPTALKVLPIAINTVSSIPGANYVKTKFKSAFPDKFQNSKELEHLFEYRDQMADIVISLMTRVPYFPLLVEALPSKNEFVGVERTTLEKYKIHAGGIQRPCLSFSFSGSYWMLSYQLGAAQCLKDYIKPHLLNDCIFLGSSSGSIIASLLALQVDLVQFKDYIISATVNHAQRFLGPVCSIEDIIRQYLEKNLPNDISCAQSRVYISLTSFPSLQNKLANQFSSQKDLIDHIMASCYIPLYNETPVCLDGQLYLNGMFSNNIPILNNYTVSISPFQNTNISPNYDRYSLHQSLFPSSNEAIYKSMYQDGYQDALRWMKLNVQTGTLTTLLFRRYPS